MTPAFADIEVGYELPSQQFPITRADLVRYCGASGDFNVIHWNERVATSVGLPNVIAHGMFTMAEAVRVVTDWLGDPGALVDYGCRFTRPVVVADDDKGALLTVTAKVTEKRDDNTALITISASCDDATVLGKAQAIVRLA
jgi:acyl dehydratase